MSLRWSLWSLLIACIVGCSNAACSNEAKEQGGVPAGAVPPRPPVDEAGEPPAVARDGVGTREPPAASPPPGTCAGPPGKIVRALVVGNSQIYYWNLPRLLSDLSQTGPAACPRIEAEGFTRGGQNLHRLWQGGDAQGRNLEATIRDGKYDVIVIAESIDLVEVPPPKAQFFEYANLIIDAARASGATPVLYATPYADQEEHAGFLEMAEPQLVLGRARGVPVAAGGLAWLRVWTRMPEIDLHHTDHAHPNYKGSTISAMVLYSVITGATPLALDPQKPRDCEGTPCAPITTSEADLFQDAAWAEATATRAR